MDGTRQNRSDHVRRIFVRGVNWLGDAVMTAPALQRLRERFPRAHIALMTPEGIAELWLHHPSVDEVIAFGSNETIWSIARRLREQSFESALVFPNSPRSAIEVWLAGIPERIGFARPLRNWFLTQALPPRLGHVSMRKKSVREIRRLVASGPCLPATKKPRNESPLATPHHICDYLQLTAVLGADPQPLPPRLRVIPEEIRKVEQSWLSPLPSKPAVLLGLNPSAAYGPAKRWPAARFAAVAREVTKSNGQALWLLFGAAHDYPLCDQIIQQAGVQALNLAGKTSLRDLMALLSLCRVVLTNDTGPMHLAAAMGTRVVVPFGSTSPELTGPGLPGAPGHYLLQSSVPCAPCYRRECPIDFRCMDNISVEQVVAAMQQALDHQEAAR